MNNKRSGQILVITLLTLTIVGVLVTTIVLVTRRDFSQSANSEKYERLYNVADNNLQTLLADYSLPAANLTALAGAGCQTIVNSNYYRCTYTSQESGTSFVSTTNVFVENKKSVDDYVLKKDNALILDVNSYLSGISFQWDKENVALEVVLVYSNNLPSGRLNIVRDIYDRNATKVVDSQTQPGFVNAFPFVQGVSNPSRSFTLDISDIFNVSSNIPGFLNANPFVPLYLAIIPRSKNLDEQITITITPDNPSTLRNQTREFRALGEDLSDPTGPKASLVARVPLLPEVPATLLNGISTNGNLILQ